MTAYTNHECSGLLVILRPLHHPVSFCIAKTQRLSCSFLFYNGDQQVLSLKDLSDKSQCTIHTFLGHFLLALEVVYGLRHIMAWGSHWLCCGYTTGVVVTGVALSTILARIVAQTLLPAPRQASGDDSSQEKQSDHRNPISFQRRNRSREKHA